MAKRDDPVQPASRAKPTDREVKLAQALRANLRRRKAELAAKPATKSPATSGDES